MDVSDEMSDEDDCLSRSMTTKAINTIMNLDQPCSQRDCVSPYVLRHWRSVERGAFDNSAKEAEFTS